MLINLVANDEIKIDKIIELELYENTLNITKISPVKVKGNIFISSTVIEYDLAIETEVEIEDLNNHCVINKALSFKIKETDEISEENLHINEKTLDLNAKMWENIVVEIFGESPSYSSDTTRGNGWALYQEEEQDDDVIDERLKPLLDLLIEEV